MKKEHTFYEACLLISSLNKDSTQDLMEVSVLRVEGDSILFGSYSNCYGLAKMDLNEHNEVFVKVIEGNGVKHYYFTQYFFSDLDSTNKLEAVVKKHPETESIIHQMLNTGINGDYCSVSAGSFSRYDTGIGRYAFMYY